MSREYIIYIFSSDHHYEFNNIIEFLLNGAELSLNSVNSANCKNYANVSVKLMFILALALVGMHSTYIGQLVGDSAAPLILEMHVSIGGGAYT